MVRCDMLGCAELGAGANLVSPNELMLSWTPEIGTSTEEALLSASD